MFKKTLALSTAALVLASNAVQAQTSASAPTSTADASAVSTPSLREKISASFSAVLLGPAMSEPLSINQPDLTTVDGGGAVELRNYLTGGYKLSPNLNTSLTAYWALQAKGAGADGNALNTVLRDAYARLTAPSVYKNGGFNLGLDTRLHLPTSIASRKDNHLVRIEQRVNPSYEIPNSRFSLSATTYARAIVRSDASAIVAEDGTSSARNVLEFYAGPQVDYKISPTLSVWLLFEASAAAKTNDILAYTSQGTDLEPGLSWDITPTVNFSPFLDIKTGGDISADTTSINAAVSWTLM